MTSISTLASLGMAIGAPLVYADQAYSIWRKRDATGFTHDVCAVLLIANITRCFFWLGEHFEFALLLQSWLMIASQLGLLYLCLRFQPAARNATSISSDTPRVIFTADQDEAEAGFNHPHPPPQHQHPTQDDEEDNSYPNKQPLLATLGISHLPFLPKSSPYGLVSGNDADAISSDSGATSTQPSASAPAGTAAAGWKAQLKKGRRPLNFWQWRDYDSYLYFLAFYIGFLGILYLALGYFATFVAALGYFALGLESTLPVPQLIANQRRRSLAGFRASVLVGWIGGDSFKLVYFLARGSPLQFTVCAVFQLSIDLLILAQSYAFRENTRRDQDARTQREEEHRAASGQTDVADIDVEQGRAGTGPSNGHVEIEQDEPEAGDIGGKATERNGLLR